MRLPPRLAAAVFDFLMRVNPPRTPAPQQGRRGDFSTNPGGKGLRFNERLRDHFRRQWLRLLK